MRVQKNLIAGLAALLVLLFVADLESFARVPGDRTEAIRVGKQAPAAPSEQAMPFSKGIIRSYEVLPVGKSLDTSMVSRFWKKILEVNYIRLPEFREVIRLPRTVKGGDATDVTKRYYRILVEE